MVNGMRGVALLLLLGLAVNGFSQQDTANTEEEDWSIYDNLDYADDAAVRYASAKIIGLSPAQFISVGYDYQAGYELGAAAFGNYAAQKAQINATHGIRVSANVPVYSTNKLIVQLGANYWDINYDYEDPASLTHPLHNTLSSNGLTTAGINSTVFKPLNESQFLLFQGSIDMNGDYAIPEFQGLRYNRYSIAGLWGKRPSDYLQWAVGLSRTYRAGQLNYIPIVMYNWTSKKEKWGTELLLPARGHVRYTIDSRNLLLLGFELEGNSYRIGNQGMALNVPFDDLEIRRSEIRFRFNYQRQFIGFFWVSAQVGYRVNYSFDVDQVENGEDFYTAFDLIRDQPFVMENDITNPLYFNLSINFVSP